jgi:glycosyltransferase involved in cell wall biosynthesis
MFQCLAAASGREVILLSHPPKAVARRKGKWLPAAETQFQTFRQFFCANWDIPKLRVPLAWFFYTLHVLRHVRSGDLVIFDNYEFIYVVAGRILRLFRRVTFVLAYLDGKHLIDHSWSRVLSRRAETWGRPMLSGAVLSTPPLGERLPPTLPKVVLPGPGFIAPNLAMPPRQPAGEVRFLFAGSMDATRGVDLLLAALEFLPETGWRLDFAGTGPLKDRVIQTTQDPRWRGRVFYHSPMASTSPEYQKLLSDTHVGLNCQRRSDPISQVTYPTKTFAYLSAGLVVISSLASSVPAVCGSACLYYDQETPAALALAMREAIEDYDGLSSRLNISEACEQYSFAASTARVRQMLQALGMVT